MAIHEGDVQSLPLAGRLLGSLRGSDAAINGPHVVGIEVAAEGVGNLDLVDAAKINAAVAPLGNIGLDGEMEVLKFSFSPQVAVVLVRLARYLNGVVDEQALFHAPTVYGAGVGEFPAVEVQAVEQRDRFAELDFGEIGCGRRGWGALAGEVGLLKL